MRDATTLANSLLFIKDKPELDLEEKLNKLSLNLNLPVSLTYVPLDQAGSLELGIGDMPVDGSFTLAIQFLKTFSLDLLNTRLFWLKRKKRHL